MFKVLPQKLPGDPYLVTEPPLPVISDKEKEAFGLAPQVAAVSADWPQDQASFLGISVY